MPHRTMAAENYHLKWDSHLSYLNSSVVTLYKNEKFADVVLYSSKNVGSGGVVGSGPTSADSGLSMVGISAHKFILSSCSQFFAAMFEAAPISAPNGGVLYVVLPPDLSHRAIQILVQYMYSGEATVANDILNEVLRGGEILKIRGLCRTTGSHPQRDPATATGANGNGSASGGALTPYGLNGARPTNSNNHTLAHSHTHGQGQGAHAVAAVAATSGSCAPTTAAASGPRYGLEQLPQQQQHHHQQQQFRGLGASVMPKDSPVIVKSPKLSGLGASSSSATSSTATNNNSSSSGSNQKLSTGGISVNKDVAIDPEDKCGYGSRTSHQQQQQDAAALSSLSGASLCCDVGCSSCPMVGDAAAAVQQLQRRQRSHSDELASTLRLSVERLHREYAEQPPPGEGYAHDDDLDMGYSHQQHHHQRQQRTTTNERVRDYFMPDHYDIPGASAKQPFGKTVDARLSVSPPHPHSFLTIKQEPADWTSVPVSVAANIDDCGERDHDNDRLSRPATPKQPLDFKMPLSGVASSGATVTAATAVSVKLETSSAHSADEDELAAPPASDYDSFQCLVCEFCKQTFDDPKTWVRHVTTHAAHAVPAGIMGGSNQSLNLPEETGGGGGGGGGSGSGSGMASNGGGDFLSKSYVPKKRRRVSQQENSLDHVTLLCDLCATSFETPAEWVRHMNNQHTEIELAMFNSKKDNELKSNVSSTETVGSNAANSGGGSSSGTYPTQLHKKYSSSHRTSLGYTASGEQAAMHDRQCDICSKKFSSHNNMLLHKRNHGVQLNGGGHSHSHTHHDHGRGHAHGHGHTKEAAPASLSSGQVLEGEQRSRHSRTPSQM